MDETIFSDWALAGEKERVRGLVRGNSGPLATVGLARCCKVHRLCVGGVGGRRENTETEWWKFPLKLLLPLLPLSLLTGYYLNGLGIGAEG